MQTETFIVIEGEKITGGGKKS